MAGSNALEPKYIRWQIVHLPRSGLDCTGSSMKQHALHVQQAVLVGVQDSQKHLISCKELLVCVGRMPDTNVQETRCRDWRRRRFAPNLVGRWLGIKRSIQLSAKAHYVKMPIAHLI
jgi:hypothetical protein